MEKLLSRYTDTQQKTIETFFDFLRICGRILGEEVVDAPDVVRLMLENWEAQPTDKVAETLDILLKKGADEAVETICRLLVG